MTQNENLKLAQRGAFSSLVIYIILSVAKYTTGYVYNSTAIRADALNNMTDILVSVAVIVGLKIPIKPINQNRPCGHLRFKSISALLASFIIMFVGIQIVIENLPRLFTHDSHIPNFITIIINMISGLVMLCVFTTNYRLSRRTKSSSLKSAAKNNLSGSLVSTGTTIGLIFTQIGFPIIGTILANILGLLIVYTGFRTFKKSIFTLGDGFSEQDLEEYRLDILEVEGVIGVDNIKGKYHGSSIFINVAIVVDPYLSLYEAHQICDKIEIHLHNKGISSAYVHPEPYTTEDEVK